MGIRHSSMCAVLLVTLVIATLSVTAVSVDSEPTSQGAIDPLSSDASVMEPGCGGWAGDWSLVNDIEDPRRVSLGFRPVRRERCLLLGDETVDGMIRATVSASGGPAGFVLRYLDPDDFLSVTVDPASGRLECTHRREGIDIPLGKTAIVPPLEEGSELLVAFAGHRIEVFLEGSRILEVDGAPDSRGRAGLFAGFLAQAEFADVRLSPGTGEREVAISPFPLPRMRVGRSVEIHLRCFFPYGTASEDREAGACRFSLPKGALPPGLTLRPDGLISGTPAEAADTEANLDVDTAGATHVALPVRPVAEGASWTRFPLNPSTGEEPVLAVLYSPDDIGRSVKMSSLGYPDGGFFLLHREHPDLKVVLMSTPANRYMGNLTILGAPRAIDVWRSLAGGKDFDWMELGGHGYTHSPPGDSNLAHHEFSTTQAGCNVDHRKLASPYYCLRQLLTAREVYRALGIPDERVTVMRFPGAVDSPEALSAAREAGFIAIFGRHHREDRGREWWLPCGPGCEMLDVEDSHLQSVAPSLEDLVRALEAGKLDPSTFQKSPAFAAALKEGREYVDGIVSGGGLLNLTNHFWKTFEEVKGVQPRYAFLSALLGGIEKRFGPRVWYPHGGELAQWLELRRRASVTWHRERGNVLVDIDPDPAASLPRTPSLDRVSMRIALPPDFGEVSQVRIDEGDGAWRLLDPSAYRPGPSGLAVSFPLRGSVHLAIASGSRSAAARSR
ncbi:MAG TPA: hypothetical protein VNI57_11220 [Candidatus Saccharimonadales bacterium]|nr:hypothetical protein [Candidatus Saccharimonadales bacterium]